MAYLFAYVALCEYWEWISITGRLSLNTSANVNWRHFINDMSALSLLNCLAFVLERQVQVLDFDSVLDCVTIPYI